MEELVVGKVVVAGAWILVLVLLTDLNPQFLEGYLTGS
jgi:hypothetical protein